MTALIWAALVPAAFAATEVGDAGDLPASAQDLGAETALGSIAGTIESETDRDVYRLCASGGGSFSASTVGTTAIDTQLFLLDDGGRAVYANDDAPGVLGQSTLPAADPLTPAAAGVYYLAITRYNQDPLTAAGARLFADVVFTTGPASSDLGAVIAGWSTGRTGATGAYAIVLTGVVPCPLPDTTAPTVDLRTPSDGASFAQGEVVVADYDCADEGGSGLESCLGDVADGEAIDTSTPGNYSFNVNARDAAGNETSISHAYTVQAPPDTIAPAVDLRTPSDGASFVQYEEVAADYDCLDDGGSGLQSCVGDVADGEALDTSTLGSHSFSVNARDGAGNETSVVHAYTVLPPPDTIAPTIDLRSPADGATYVVGEQLLADYDCLDDGGSGVQSCAGDVADGEAIDTSTAGDFSFTVHAADTAGNTAVRTVAYTVDEEDTGGGFEFEGFFSPLDDAPPALNRIKAGKDVPVRFRLGGDQGEDVFADGFPRSARVPCGQDADADTAKPTRSPWWWRQWLDGDIRYNRWTDAYTYLWKTDSDWAGSCRQLIVKFTDGSIERVNVEFPRRWGHGWNWRWDDRGRGNKQSRGHDARNRKHRR